MFTMLVPFLVAVISVATCYCCFATMKIVDLFFHCCGLV